MYSLQNRERALTIAFASILAGLSLLLMASQVYARVSSPRGDEIVADAESIDTVMSRLTLGGISAATSSVLVDLSDGTNFKHINANSGSVDVLKFIVNWSTLTTASSTLKIGVVASSSPSGAVADIIWLENVSFDSGIAADTTANLNGRNQSRVFDYSPAALRTRISSATSTDLLSNEISNSISGFATTTAITSPLGSFKTFPNVGDIVLYVERQSGPATTSVSTFYKVTE